MLQQAGISADFFHAGLNRDEKELRQARWKNNECRVIVSTNAFGMGIDNPRPICHPLQYAPEHGELLSGGRTCRERWRTFAMRSAVLGPGCYDR